MDSNRTPKAGSAISPTHFANGKRTRSTNEASDSTVRKLWMIVELLRHKRLSFETYEKEHERDRRSFQRDLQQLREIGERSGFTISAIHNGFVELACGHPKILALQKDATQTEKLIGDVARAMGQPIATEIGQLPAEPEPDDERFYHIAVPTMIEGDGSRISAITTALKSAWTKKALVTFQYPDRVVAKGSHERLVRSYRP